MRKFFVVVICYNLEFWQITKLNSIGCHLDLKAPPIISVMNMNPIVTCIWIAGEVNKKAEMEEEEL